MTTNHDNDSNMISSQDVQNLDKILDKQTLATPLVAVYCGSREGKNPLYMDSAKELGRQLAKHGLGLVYGGASIGLMGAVADGVLEEGGTVIGVIPTFMLEHEVAHKKLTRLHLTDTMHTRKAIMASYADAFITLPGGLGTLEEIMEIATWRQLYQHEKPMIILNINGYYNRLIGHLTHTAEEGFMKADDLDRLVVCSEISSAINVIKSVVTIHDPIATEKM